MLRTLWNLIEALGAGVWRLLCALVGAGILGVVGYSRFEKPGLLGGAVAGLVVGWLFGRFVGPEDVLT
jgi:fructose-specific phosphotransferase system IIC component